MRAHRVRAADAAPAHDSRRQGSAKRTVRCSSYCLFLTTAAEGGAGASSGSSRCFVGRRLERSQCYGRGRLQSELPR